MRELKVNKKLKKKIVGRGYKNTHEWIQAKIKRIIFIDIFAAIPEVAALIALVDSLFSIRTSRLHCMICIYNPLSIIFCFKL